MILEYYTLISILLLAFVWLLNIDTIAHMCNNYKLFSTFTPLIERIVGAVAVSYGKGNISITWRTPTGINYIVNMIDILYTPNLFTNLFLILKLRVSGLYIIIKDYII